MKVLPVLIIASAFMFFSCQKMKTGVCEFAVHDLSYYDNEFYCYPVESESECDYGSVSVYHESSSCKDLGYTSRPITEVWFESSSGPSYPGDYGSFSGSGGGDYDDTPSYCTDSYEGPSDDPQRDSYCESAYVYLCSSGYSEDSEEVTTNCQYFEAMQGSNYVSCPYCR
ncbi:MAG: hypothetical protein C0594_06175 [Marinilabiliales bacterium]|nr:MAG: hypothetical protein C0594_06175 [Marinilabiliales bacterium]